MVTEQRVDGWHDPRLPTLVGARRRGYTPGALRLFTDRLGVSKSDSWIDYSVLEGAVRDDLNIAAERRVGVLRPLKLIIDNYPDDATEQCIAPNHPQQPERGKRSMPFSRELWIEVDDFMEVPTKGYFRLAPGAEVRLRYAYVIKCVSVEKDRAGKVEAVHCTYDPNTRSGTAGADAKKVKGNIHWVSARHALPAEIRLYDRLFTTPVPGSRGGHLPSIGEGDGEEGDWLAALNPASKEVVHAFVEPALANSQAEERFQFERLGYFIVDRFDSKPGALVFNRIVDLRDTWIRKV